MKINGRTVDEFSDKVNISKVRLNCIFLKRELWFVFTLCHEQWVESHCCLEVFKHRFVFTETYSELGYMQADAPFKSFTLKFLEFSIASPISQHNCKVPVWGESTLDMQIHSVQ